MVKIYYIVWDRTMYSLEEHSGSIFTHHVKMEAVCPDQYCSTHQQDYMVPTQKTIIWVLNVHFPSIVSLLYVLQTAKYMHWAINVPCCFTFYFYLRMNMLEKIYMYV